MSSSILDFTTTKVYLSLERYYNLGLTPDEAVQAIKSVNFCGDLYPERTGFNHNYSFCTPSRNYKEINEIVCAIELNIIQTLANRGIKS